MADKIRHLAPLTGALALLFVALIFLSGCPLDKNPTNLIKAAPEVQAFLGDNPGASIRVIYLDLNYVAENIRQIRADCGDQMGIVPYYYGIVVDEDRIIEAYTDEDATRILCMITPASSTEPGEHMDALAGLSEEEAEFQEIVCSELPLAATHLANDLVAVFIPASLPYKLQEMGAQMELVSSSAAYETEQQYYDPDTNSGAYYWNCWSNGGALTHICTIPISATFIDDSGNTEAKSGAIRMRFEGPLEALESVTAEAQATTSSDKTLGDGPAPQPSYPVGDSTATTSYDPLLVSSFLDSDCPQPSGGGGGMTIVSGATGRYWLPEYEEMAPNCDAGLKKATPTFTRTSCVIDFEEPCPGMEGFESCGRCPYKLTTYMLIQEKENIPNLGQCRYCGDGEACAATNDYALCRSPCAAASSPNTGGGEGGEKTYYVNCGQCEFGDPITYWGPDYWACNGLYYDCVDAGCGKIYDNCR